jgi:hypothetical protein
VTLNYLFTYFIAKIEALHVGCNLLTFAIFQSTNDNMQRSSNTCDTIKKKWRNNFRIKFWLAGIAAANVIFADFLTAWKHDTLICKGTASQYTGITSIIFVIPFLPNFLSRRCTLNFRYSVT